VTDRPRLAAAAFTLAAPAVVVVLSRLDVLPMFPTITALLAIAAATAAGGVRFGIAATVLALVPFVYYFVESERELLPEGPEAVAAASLFGLAGAAVSVLLARERHASAVAEAALSQGERLRAVADALAEAVTPDQVLAAVLGAGLDAAEARAGLIAVLSKDGETLEVITQRGYDERLVGEDGRYHTVPVAADLPLPVAVRTGEPLFFASAAERNERFPLLRGVADDGHALACLPLTVEGRAVGGLVFSFAEDGEFDPQRRALKSAIASQAGVALERARLYDLAERARARAAFLAEASGLLSSSLVVEGTLARLAELAVPRLADWCVIDMVGADGAIDRLAVAHQDPAKVAWAEELRQRYPPDPDAPTGVPHVVRTGEPEFLPEIPQELLEAAGADDPELAEVIRQLGLRSWLCVPLIARGRTLGALTLVGAESGRTFTRDDFELAQELAARAAIAVDNARLYRESERRADAARALASIGDGVVLLDAEERVRSWNPAMTILTGVPETGAVGRRIDEVLPGWVELRAHVAPAPSAEHTRPTTVPLAAAGPERWVSVTAVAFDGGSVYALRDVTGEQALERARTEFVATASHELRTPIAAVYGAVRTLRRVDIELPAEERELFLEIIESEGERLAALVEQILLAGQIDADTVGLRVRECDLEVLAEGVLASARAHAPANIRLELRAPDDLPLVSCDEDRLRQVLVNLVENAVKYSPAGGDVTVELSSVDGTSQIAVRDEGLGVPPGEHERIFEKFYRLDPGMARGVGGSGLGLYIARELVARMGGRLRVDSGSGRGSTFTVELPTG
jgi:signal transduction histidine kinase